MFSSLMKVFDRVAVTLFVGLAMTPMLALAVAATIH